MKANDIWQARAALGKLLNSDKIDIHIAYRLKPVAKACSELEQAVHDLIRSLPHSKDNGRIIVIGEALTEYNEQLEKLMAEDVGLATVPTVTLDEVEKVGLSSMELLSLDWLVAPPGGGGGTV